MANLCLVSVFFVFCKCIFLYLLSSYLNKRAFKKTGGTHEKQHFYWLYITYKCFPWLFREVKTKVSCEELQKNSTRLRQDTADEFRSRWIRSDAFGINQTELYKCCAGLWTGYYYPAMRTWIYNSETVSSVPSWKVFHCALQGNWNWIS